jgi:hypothetical protein
MVRDCLLSRYQKCDKARTPYKRTDKLILASTNLVLEHSFNEGV